MSAGDGFQAIGSEALRLLCGDRRRVEITAIRRVVSDAVQAWPGTAPERWWKWLVEAGRGLGYATRVIDASPQEVFELLRHGVVAITRPEADSVPDSGLLALCGAKRRLLLIHELPGEPGGRWISERELPRRLGTGMRSTGTCRWVVLDPMTDDTPLTGRATSDHGEESHHGLSPWRRLWEFLRPERSDMGIVLVLAVVIGLLTLATPIAVEALVNTVAFGTLLQPLVVLSIILLTFLSFAAALKFLEKFVVELLQQRLFARVAARLAWQLPRVRLSEAHEFCPELINRFFDVMTVQKIVAQLLLDGLTVVLTVGLGMIVLAFYHPWLLAFDAVLVVMLFFNVFILGRGAVRTSVQESKQKYELAGWLEDIVRCPVLFKAGGAAEFALSRTDRLTTDYILARRSHFRVLMRQIMSGLALEALASAVLLGLGGLLVIQGQMTLGQLVAAELIVTLIVTSVAKLDKHLEGFYDLMASMDKLGHLFDLPVESSAGIMHSGRAGAARLSLCNVELAGDHGQGGVRNVSFDLSPGEVVALTGPAGSGKSTLMELLFRLRDPDSGHILLDDFDIADFRPDVYRKHVALVRDVEILEGTLAENVHLDRPEVTTAVVHMALQRVGLEIAGTERDAAATRHGSTQAFWNLDTPLTSTGRPLSTSQCWRLMLARALAGRPRLLLIDGLMDALQDEDAELLLEELKRTRADCSVLLVTSRRNLAERCDRIWTLPEH